MKADSDEQGYIGLIPDFCNIRRGATGLEGFPGLEQVALGNAHPTDTENFMRLSKISEF